MAQNSTLFGKVKLLRADMVSRLINTPGVKFCRNQLVQGVRKRLEDIGNGVAVSNTNHIIERDQSVRLDIF